jgi:2-keto-4-pentenoate hydratase
MMDAALSDPRTLLAQHPGEPPFGWKVAINSEGAQQKLGLSHALAAPLGTKRTQASGAAWSFDDGSLPYVEAELGLTLAVDVTAKVSLEALRAAIASYTPCLELVDYAKPKKNLSELLTHSFFHAGIVLGEPLAPPAFAQLLPTFPHAHSAAGLVRQRSEGAVPNDVVEALHGLVDWVLEAGGSMRQGQLILCGSYIEPVPLPRGASLRVDFGPGFSPVQILRT